MKTRRSKVTRCAAQRYVAARQDCPPPDAWIIYPRHTLYLCRWYSKFCHLKFALINIEIHLDDDELDICSSDLMHQDDGLVQHEDGQDSVNSNISNLSDIMSDSASILQIEDDKTKNNPNIAISNSTKTPKTRQQTLTQMSIYKNHITDNETLNASVMSQLIDINDINNNESKSLFT